jgi:tetratricopeptide (TPR) repeat protein
VALGKIKNKSTKQQDLTEPDEFLQKSSSVMDRILENPRRFVVVTVAVIVAILALLVIASLVEEGKRSVSDSYAAALEVYQAQVVKEGDTPPETAKKKPTFSTDEAKYQAAAEKFASFLKDNSGSAFETLAHMYNGLANMKIKQYAKAEQAFGSMIQSVDNDDPLWSLGHKLLGQTYEDQEKWEKALAEYKIISAQESMNFLKDVSLYMEGRMLERLNRDQEAMTAYVKMLDSYPESSFKASVEKRKMVLEAKGIPAPKTEKKADEKADEGK